MTEPNLITKPDVAPARVPLPQRLKQLLSGRIKIIGGAGAYNGDMPTDKSVCIMEATSYVLGYEQITDEPPCTSESITGFMIDLNDAITSDRRRAQLKKVIPDIINTAPTVWVEVPERTTSGRLRKDKDGNKITFDKLARNSKDPDYMEAERKRVDMVDAFQDANVDHHDLPMRVLLEFIRELAAVAKFDKANGATELDVTTPAIDPEEA